MKILNLQKVGGRKKKYVVSNFTILWIPWVVVLVSPCLFTIA